MTHLNLSGYPGAGKTTIFNLFLDIYPETVVIPKVTTRPRRPEEGDLEYIFLSNSEFESKCALGQIVGVEEIPQKGIICYYGIPTPALWPPVPSSTKILLSLFGEKAPEVRGQFLPGMKLIFLSLSDKPLLVERLRERCMVDGSDFQARFNLIQSYLSSGIEDLYDHIVNNDTSPEECLEKIISLIT
ncbi:MAG: hypothetical protein NTW98_02350 [Candidatus Nomurabacteria bacterium]|nr:hypothetical protein [Candidatus Nomurabacteria bacterium]